MYTRPLRFFASTSFNIWQNPSVFEHSVRGLPCGPNRVCSGPTVHAHFGCKHGNALEGDIPCRGSVVSHVAGLEVSRALVELIIG